jgi:hypothetical protein
MSYNLNESAKGVTMCHGKPAIAIGDGAKTGPAFVTTSLYSIDGITYSKTGAATVIPFTALGLQAALTKCLYLAVIDSAGTVTFVKGTAVLTADLTAGTAVLKWPAVPAGKCPWGAVKIACASTATFTPGTTALDAANITATYYDLATVPTAPLTS